MGFEHSPSTNLTKVQGMIGIAIFDQWVQEDFEPDWLAVR